MIIVTGGAGFIGSAFVWKLNQEGVEDIMIVDRLGTTDKWKNLVNLRFEDYIYKDDFFQMIAGTASQIKKYGRPAIQLHHRNHGTIDR